MSVRPHSWLRPLSAHDMAYPVDDIALVGSTALAFVMDRELESSRLLTVAMAERGVSTETFADPPALLDAMARQVPDLVFIDVASEITESIDVIFSLGERSYPGLVQLMSSHDSPLVDSVRHVGQRHSLRMLPPLAKPLDPAALRRNLDDRTLEATAFSSHARLDEALRSDWIQFWYQPKIDLDTRHVVGVEAFARVFHPNKGVLLPIAFLSGADEKSLAALSERALVSALKASVGFAVLGINLRVAINIPLNALRTLPIEKLVQEYRPRTEQWPGLIFDVTEGQIVQDRQFIREIVPMLHRSGIQLAIDDYGGGQLSRTDLEALSFTEIKLNRTFVTNCRTASTEAVICQSLIDLAHGLGSIAVAIGIESASDVATLYRMGCDVGQGYLFGQPMPENHFIGLLRERARGRTQA